MRSMFGGRGAALPVMSATNEVASSTPSARLNRRSNPIVEDAFELMARPQREPATWPG